MCAPCVHVSLRLIDRLPPSVAPVQPRDRRAGTRHLTRHLCVCVCVYRRSFDGWLERRSRRGKLRTDGVKRWRVLVQCLVTALPSDNVTRKRFFFSHQGIWNRSMMRSLFPISLDYLSRQRNEPFLHFHGFRVSISLFGRTSSTFDVRVRNFKRKLSSISGKVWNEVFRRTYCARVKWR